MIKAPDKEQDKREEKLGRTIFNVSYWIYAIRFVVIASLLALVLLYLFRKPLWLSPIIGYTVFILWRTFRRFILKKLLFFLR